MSSTTEAPSTEAIQHETVSDNTTTTIHEHLAEVLTADEVASLLRVNRKTVYAAFKAGEIPGGRRIGGTIRFHRDAVLNWLAHGQEHVSRSPRGAR